MKRIGILLLLCLASLSSYGADEWKLVWSDEFNYQGAPDPAKWDFEEGFIRNKEAQYYTKNRLENARVENGMLVIEGRKEHFKNPDYRPGAPADDWKHHREYEEYTSASLITLHKAEWTYGRIEVRAKVPEGAGVWPAIWTLGSDKDKVGWPTCGEIDIMEFWGRTPDKIAAHTHFMGPTTHKHQSDGKDLVVDKPFDDFHIYAIEWDSSKIDFFFDGRKYHTFMVDEAGKGADNAFRKPQYLILNLALGGNSNDKIDDSKFPRKFLIDYVRVYSK